MIAAIRANWQIIGGMCAAFIFMVGMAGTQAVQAETVRRNDIRLDAMEKSMPSLEVTVAVMNSKLDNISAVQERQERRGERIAERLGVPSR